MTATTLRRTGALLVSAALLASLTVAAVAAPASAAKPKCAGKTATIVGTNKGEVIKGTNKADVIVAKGGHDRIYGRGGNDTICGGGGHDKIVGAAGNDLLFGQSGRDKLFGGAGRDRLLGGPANDRLAGGPGSDACLQGAGIGVRVGCERPALAPVPVPAPVIVVPPPPIPAPDPIDLANVIAIAYTDLNKNQTPDAGDVMIAQLVDTDSNGADEGDKVVMGMYPTKLNPVWPGDFKKWTVKSHTVDNFSTTSANYVALQTTTGTFHSWWASKPPGSPDQYYESSPVSPFPVSTFLDNDGGLDAIETDPESPSEPDDTLDLDRSGTTDDYFIDVEVY